MTDRAIIASHPTWSLWVKLRLKPYHNPRVGGSRPSAATNNHFAGPIVFERATLLYFLDRSPEARIPNKIFQVVLIKPSKYDDDGYPIQWRRGSVPSNSLACLYSLTEEVRDSRRLGPDVALVLSAFDEINCRVSAPRIIRRIKRSGGAGIVCMVGVQSNQYPRACDLSRRFLAAGVRTLIGGFHVSGTIAMLPKMPPELQSMMAEGATLVAGEIEGRWLQILTDALHGKLHPLYNFLEEKPALEGYPAPIMPNRLVRRYVGEITTFDAGRGCPFECSFCTIINVQGRKSRGRSPDDVEKIVRENHRRGIRRYFITDDDFARHRGWEAIFDRLILLREKEGIKVTFTIQVDTACHRLPRFIEKAARAGCTKVFIGLENINPDSLKGTGKKQNHVEEYRAMLQAWRERRVITYAGYIIGFPGDTYESVMRDIETIKRDLPIDLLEFFFLTPLPGSEDHQKLHAAGVPMDPDLNNYDTEHPCLAHDRMTREEWIRAYNDAWRSFYSPEHIETILRRAGASRISLGKLIGAILWFYGSIVYEKVHPLQAGILRIKDRRARRPGLPIESAVPFYLRRAKEIARILFHAARLGWSLHKIRKKVEASPDFRAYTDPALAPAERKSALAHLIPL